MMSESEYKTFNEMIRKLEEAKNIVRKSCDKTPDPYDITCRINFIRSVEKTITTARQVREGTAKPL